LIQRIEVAVITRPKVWDQSSLHLSLRLTDAKAISSPIRTHGSETLITVLLQRPFLLPLYRLSRVLSGVDAYVSRLP
jgi:hypothetical protein